LYFLQEFNHQNVSFQSQHSAHHGDEIQSASISIAKEGHQSTSHAYEGYGKRVRLTIIIYLGSITFCNILTENKI